MDHPLAIFLLVACSAVCAGTTLRAQQALPDTARVSALLQLTRKYADDGKTDSTLIFGRQTISLAQGTGEHHKAARAFEWMGTASGNIGKYAEADTFLLKSLKIARRYNLKEIEGACLDHLGFYSYRQGKFPQAFDYYEQSEAVFNRIGDKTSIAKAVANQGSMLRFQAEYTRSLAYLLRAVTLSEQAGDQVVLGYVLNEIGVVYEYMNNGDRMLEYYLKAFEVREKTGRKGDIAITLLNIGNFYLEREEFKKALDYSFRSLKLKDRTKNPHSYAFTLNSIGEVYRRMKHYDLALKYFFETVAIREKLKDKEHLTVTLQNISTAYRQMGQTDKALHYALRVRDLAFSVSSRKRRFEAYKLLSEVYESRNDYKTALRYRDLYVQVRDSAINEETALKAANLQAVYEKEKQEKELAAAKTAEYIAALDLQKESARTRQWLIGFICIAALLVFVVLIYFNLKRTKKIVEQKNIALESVTAQLRELHKAKDRLFAIVAHDLRGPVTSFQSVSRLIHKHIRQQEWTKLELLDSHIDQSVNNLNGLLDNLLSWTLSHTENISLTPRPLRVRPIAMECMAVFQPAAIAKRLRISCDIPDHHMVMADSNVLALVFRNLISNAIKFTPPGGDVVIQSLGVKENELCLQVKDSGIGLDEVQRAALFSLGESKRRPGTAGEKGTGLGLLLCREYLQLSGGTIAAEADTHGTTMTFSLPAYRVDQPDMYSKEATYA